MNFELVVLRILHIVSGVFWAGAALYLALVLEPRLRQLGDEVEATVLQSISKVNSLWITASATVTIIAGFALIARTPGRSFSQLGNTGWGTAITIGMVAAILSYFLSGYVGALTAKLRRSLADGQQSEGAAGARAAMRARIALLTRINTVLILVAVGSMASARFV